MAGIAAAAVALGVTQLVAAFVGPQSDSRTAIGSSVIDLTPGPLKEWAITTFGTADKLALSILVLAVIAVIAAVAGSLERPRVPIGSAAIVAAGVAGCAAVLSRGGQLPVDIVPTFVGTVCGVVVMRLLTSGRFTDAPVEPADPDPSDEPDPGRRLSLITLGLLTAGAVSGVVGVVLSRARTSVAGDRDAFTLPAVDVKAPPIPPTVQPQGVALPSFVTSNDDFYRIDTALTVPQLSRAEWQLKIHGMVDREITYRFEDLDRFEVVEKVVTLTCVSNPVGGNLISNASWTGYRVRDLLADAGVHADADMVLSTSSDGFTAGTPVEALTDSRDALLAVGMNGQPLPTNHGYPARVRVGHQVGCGS
jgi:DMSO/TMAO reductase YedYZ molybdopterin-dependent catalytic subunit